MVQMNKRLLPFDEGCGSETNPIWAPISMKHFDFLHNSKYIWNRLLCFAISFSKVTKCK